MSEPIIFISHFKIKEGKLGELNRLNQMVSQQIQADKPGTLAFLQYTNAEGTELSIVHVFPDAEAMDEHVAGAGERAKTAFELIVPTRREVYGKPSDRALEMLKPADGSGIDFQRMPQLEGGYLRIQQA
jgi:quinol monooxygenase YgiN